MQDIHHQFQVHANIEKVFKAISEPSGLDAWWAKRSKGKPQMGEVYELYFSSGYDWRARVTECRPNNKFRLEMVQADPDWIGSYIGFDLTFQNGSTSVMFLHSGWPDINEHYRISCYCWAMYLRLLKRYVEFGEVVPYEKRLDV